MIMAFIDQMRGKGYAVESVCQILCEQGLQVAARTYRSWRAGRISARTITDAYVIDMLLVVAWCVRWGRRQRTPVGLYGYKKMTAYLRRTTMPQVGRGTVRRAMKALGLAGVRRLKKVKTTIPAQDGRRAGDLLNRDFHADAPNRVWVSDFTYVRTKSGMCYVAFVVDVFAQYIVGWYAQTSMTTDLVMRALRDGLWERDRGGHPVVAGDLVAHSDYAEVFVKPRISCLAWW